VSYYQNLFDIMLDSEVLHGLFKISCNNEQIKQTTKTASIFLSKTKIKLVKECPEEILREFLEKIVDLP
jgi:hypothetical protein